jgi:hypothetical protein
VDVAAPEIVHIEDIAYEHSVLRSSCVMVSGYALGNEDIAVIVHAAENDIGIAYINS